MALKAWLLQAEHPVVPGIITRIFRSEAAAMAYRDKEVLAEAFEGKFAALEEEHGAEHCWVDITEHEIEGEPTPEPPVKIKRMISKGDLTWEPHETSQDVLNEVARILDKSYVSAGTVYFEGEDGKFYTVEILGEIFEVDKEQVDEFMELEAEVED